MFSATVMCGKSAKLWKTVFTGRRCGGVPTIARPWIRISPASGSTKPPIRLKVVVFPQPLGPSKEKNSPSPMRSVASRTAVTSP